MAIHIEGKYDSDEDRDPYAIEAWGDAPEVVRATDGYWGHPVEDDIRSILVPARREFVRHVAERAEVACDDERLIDWMKRGE